MSVVVVVIVVVFVFVAVAAVQVVAVGRGGGGEVNRSSRSGGSRVLIVLTVFGSGRIATTTSTAT